MFFKILFLITPVLFILFHPTIAFAGEPPQLSSPSNGSSVSSTTLNWQAPSYTLYSSNPYRVQVDDDPSFSPSSDIYRDTYKTSTTYTPELSPGTWYWRVKAKDSAGTWSDWSSVWSFTLSLAPSETPNPSTNPSPTPSPSPSTSSSSSSTSGSSSTSSFIISGAPSQLNSDQTFSAAISLSLPSNPSSTFYLKGAFKKSDGSNYFGKTLVSGSWVKNGSSYSSQYQITTDASGNWSGNLEVQPDSEDSGFTGTGDYIFKVGRYSQAGSGPSWSNEVTLKIVGTSSSSSNSSSGSTGSSSKSTATPTPSPKTGTTQSSNTSSSKSIVKLPTAIASVAGEATYSATESSTPSPEPETEVKGNRLNFLPWVGGGFILAGISSLIFIYLRAKRSP